MSKLAIIPFLFIIIFYYIQKNENYSLTQQNLTIKNPNIAILDINQFKKFINDDNDNYISSLSVYDLRARKQLNSTGYIKAIVDSVNYILSEELKKKLIKICNMSDDLIIKFYPELYSIDWNIALFDNKIYEGGYPHTRANIIFIPIDILLYTDDKTLVKTFIHEKIHILQRTRPNSKMLNEFLSSNNFRKYKSINDMRKTHPRCRSNPDLDSFIYCDDSKFYLCEYTKDYPDSIMDVIQSNDLEHPYEIMAYRISEELIKFY